MSEEKNPTKEVKNSGVELLEKEEKTEKTEDTKELEILEENLTENKEEENKKSSANNKLKIILIIAIILIVLSLVFSVIFAFINSKSSKIVKGTIIGQIDVSDLTQEEAREKLEKVYQSKSEKQIYLKYGEYETSITYEALEVEYQVSNAIQDAFDIGRTGNLFKDNYDILATMINGKKIKLEASIDNDMISQISQNINNSIEGAIVQPSYYLDRENDKLVITSGKEGKEVDEKQLIKEIYAVIDTNTEDEKKIEIPVLDAKPEKIDIDKIHDEVYKQVKDAYYTNDPFTIYPEEEGIDFDVDNAKAMLTETKDEYQIDLIITKPTKTTKDIGTEAFPDLLGTCSTNYQASNTNRTTNLILASNKINGTVLLPNEEFSYNKIVGERTIAAGYKSAATFSNGKVVDGLGGGICQISSTLYDAVVFANLNVTTRRNHQFVTSYLPAGKDATVVWGSQDFKFVNSRKYPIRITATVENGVATIQVWGVKEDVEYDISIETKKIATINPTTQYVQDSNLASGEQKVVQAGSYGRKVEAYKVMRLNGQVVSTTLLSRDTYNAMARIVHIGTGN
mgnify:CR=1 FL=1